MKKIKAILIIILFILSFIPAETLAVKEIKTDETAIFLYNSIDWWEDFNDPYLMEYLVKALQCNHDLKIAELKVEESRQNKNIKRADEMPSFGIGAVPALYKIPSDTNSEGLFSLPLYASYEIDIFGKNRDKTKSMDKLIEISRQNERAVHISTAGAVGTAYYNIVKLDKLIELQEKIIQDREKIYNLMKISNEEGLVSTADTVNANKALIKANSDITELKKARGRMLNMLAVLTGSSPENSKEYNRISYDDLKINKKIPDYINSNVIEARPDYISAEKALEKTGLDIKAAKKEFLPGFNIIGLISFNTTEYLSKFNCTNSAAVLGGGMLLPLFTGGRRIANLKLQKNKYEQALENYKKTNLTAIQEVNDTLYDLKSDNEKYLKTVESYEAEKEDFYYSDLKFQEGIISNLDLLQKNETLLVTEKQLVQDKTNLFINQIGLYKALAGGKI